MEIENNPMYFSFFNKTTRPRGGIKSTKTMILLIIIISGLLTSFFIIRQKNILTEQHRTRIQTLGENLVSDIIDIVLRNDYTTNTLWHGVVRIEEDVTDAFLVNNEGIITDHIRAAHSGTIITMPSYIDSLTENNWFPTDEKNKQRLFLPIEVVKETFDLMSDDFISHPDKTPVHDGKIHTKGACYFPSFTNDSQEVTFCTTDFETGYYLVASVNIESKKMRRILDKGNGFWSHDGRYLACTRGVPGKKTSDIAIYDTEKDETRVIASFSGWPVNCFTADNKYVITTMRKNEREGKLFRIPFDGGEPEQLTSHSGSHWYPKCSSDGKWLIYTKWPDMELWVYNFESKKSICIFPESEYQFVGASFSPDVKKICYNLYPDSTRFSEVYIADFPFGKDTPTKKNDYGKKITLRNTNRWYTDWSPDGKWIAYHMHGDVWIVPTNGGEPINLTDAIKKNERLGYIVIDVSMERLKIAIRNNTYKSLFIMFSVICLGVIATIYVEKKHYELEKAHGELGKAYRELETLDKAKDDFLSLVSHELRTPLGSMLLHADMLLNKLVDSEEKQTEYHANIVEDCKRLTRLVNDVLDLSKIEAGRMPFTFVTLPVRELLSDIYSSLRPALESKSLHFDYNAVPEDVLLHGDRDRIIEVLTNIITNAIKFTPEGGSITVSLTSSEKTATIAVKDTGTGIAEKDIPKVFDRFSQLENINHHSDGTGLGMAISKSIVEHHDGTIWIESELGKGTTVFLTLPLEEKYPEPVPVTDSGILPDVKKTEKSTLDTQQKKLLILIVDDEKSYRHAIADCVRSADYDSVEAADGNEALRMVQEHRPILIILDVMMRGLSGLDVCRELKSNPNTREIKIIMLSARGQEKEQEKGLKAGADRYITKPFNYKNLLETIEKLIND